MRNVTLTVTFDIDQDSQLLQWGFEADGKPLTGEGVETGLLAFKRQDKIELVVQAKSKNNNLKQVKIEDCYMITTPRAFTARENPEHAGEFPEPSPFGDHSAVVSFGQGTIEGTVSKAQWQSDVIPECTNLGRWDMSLIMTTAISRTGDSACHPERRVFGFDPECEVGSGV
ncbi:hypothetical protein LJR289_002549 [Pseudoduganella sp. LjRoot289]|uniref:hypothetical protein n=1 Tax=Pseudoduganella sp. LjRoot289 TaxID=3342314 RepID=UPI003ECED156